MSKIMSLEFNMKKDFITSLHNNVAFVLRVALIQLIYESLRLILCNFIFVLCTLVNILGK